MLPVLAKNTLDIAFKLFEEEDYQFVA